MSHVLSFPADVVIAELAGSLLADRFWTAAEIILRTRRVFPAPSRPARGVFPAPPSRPAMD